MEFNSKLLLLTQLLFLSSLFVRQTNAQTWPHPRLLPMDEVREEINWVLNSEEGTAIDMHESMPDNVFLARLNYDGSETPLVGSFTQGIRALLEPVIIQDATIDPANPDAWYLVITEMQDYESGHRRYQFTLIIVEGETTLRHTISIGIVNIDDNPPIISPNTCIVPEAMEGLTSCKYSVFDADGWMSIEAMTIHIAETAGVAEIFDFELERDRAVDEFNMHITLETLQPLDFILMAFYSFPIRARDTAQYSAEVMIMVQVQNVESRPPRWVQIWAVQQFDEMTSQEFPVRAIDGDTGINADISYALRDVGDWPFITIDENTGVLYVTPINRDELQIEMFPFQIVAYKIGELQTWETPFNVVIIVDDINNNKPEPLHDTYYIEIPEETFMTVDFVEFGFHDIDLGINAQYDVELISVYPEGAANAFTVAPNQGYQRQTFFVTVNDAAILDYENTSWQEISMVFRATELENPEHIGNADVTIRLINWNDELPIFESDSYTASFRENEGAGFSVITVKANDRDIDDRIVYNLLGNANNFLDIDQDTGEITVSQDDAFNYQRQNQIVVQITATDTLGDDNHHTATTQLTIELEDVNNTPPEIRMPQESLSVLENSVAGVIITREVIGSDMDTSAIVEFEIVWETTFATKQGRRTLDHHYQSCVAVETVYTTPGDTRSAAAHITVTGDPIIDFEEFDVLYLTLRIVDTMTEYSEPHRDSTLAIAIIDENDNSPIFFVEPADLELVVREMADEGVIIGSVLANDIDGPMYNQVGYKLEPRAGTPAGLVRVDELTGQITVHANREIDADEPRDNLYYTIVAEDSCKEPDTCGPDPHRETIRELQIRIIDTNNQVPELSPFDYEVKIYEDATTGYDIITLEATDGDRDVPYHTIHYSINFGEHPNLRNFFAVNEDTGLVYVNYVSDVVLDRDRGVDTHVIFLTLVDNFDQYGDRNMNRQLTSVTVILLDVNDNAPTLPSPDVVSWTISEGLGANEEIGEIYAPDIDEPNTVNSQVAYNLTLEIENRNIDLPDILIRIDTHNWETGHLITEIALKGFWGTYSAHIGAFDHGIPKMDEKQTYLLTIEPYNFHHPVFTFPTNEYVIRLSREVALQSGTLLRLDRGILEPISATDEDGLHAGHVEFAISGDDAAVELFGITELLDNTAQLTIPTGLSDLEPLYTFTLTATDRGTVPGPLSATITVTVRFVAETGFPVYENNEQTVTFTEGEAGLSERVALTDAADPRNIDCFEDDCIQIYYFIWGGTSSNLFDLESDTNKLTLRQPLDHDAVSQHTFTVAATVTNNRPVAPDSLSLLDVTVDVLESNPMPRFVRAQYTAGISVADIVGRELLTVHATHSLNEDILYAIDFDSMIVDPTLSAVQNSAFTLNAVTGVLNLNFQVLASMNGIFAFDITATDKSNTVATEVRIFLVSELNRVSFAFYNTLSEVEMETTFIAGVFTDAFDMVCNIDSVSQAADENGVAEEHITQLRTHFIQDDVAVPATEIEIRRSDAFLVRHLQQTLSTRGLNLGDLFTSAIAGQTSSFDAMLQITLIIVSCVLAVLCVLLLVGYCYKTTSLTRRLDSLSTTKFGSHESGLNRVGVVVPGTNKHAVEGSNPVWNEQIKAPDFDNMSDTSGDSDLIGIEDNPHFARDFFSPEVKSFTPGNFGDQNINPNDIQNKATTSADNGKVNPSFEAY